MYLLYKKSLFICLVDFNLACKYLKTYIDIPIRDLDIRSIWQTRPVWLNFSVFVNHVKHAQKNTKY